MKDTAKYIPYEVDQLYLLPPDMKSWLPKGHLSFFIIEIVNELNLKPIYKKYKNNKGGRPAYHPVMMTSLLLYSYCTGIFSSREIEKKTYEDVAFRVMAGDKHPDHDTICEFRRENLMQLSTLFIQVLNICKKTGLVKVGHVAIDGTKMQSNASKHKAMSYGRMVKKEEQLEKEVNTLLENADLVDSKEDNLFGKGVRGDEIPDHLKNTAKRLEKIRAAKAALEEEANEQLADKKKEYLKKKKDHENRGGRGRPPSPPSEKPADNKQYNFTDPESRIMKSRGKDNFLQGYNCQAAVDEENQIIVASSTTQEANDKNQLLPLVLMAKNNMKKKPAAVTADAGYFSEKNIITLDKKKINAYVATGKIKHGEKIPSTKGRPKDNATIKELMKRKLNTQLGKDIYSKRKYVVEPVFGHIKEILGFRKFSFIGLEKCSQEWDLICIAHNLLKLFRINYATT